MKPLVRFAILFLSIFTALGSTWPAGAAQPPIKGNIFFVQMPKEDFRNQSLYVVNAQFKTPHLVETKVTQAVPSPNGKSLLVLMERPDPQVARAVTTVAEIID